MWGPLYQGRPLQVAVMCSSVRCRMGWPGEQQTWPLLGLQHQHAVHQKAADDVPVFAWCHCQAVIPTTTRLRFSPSLLTHPLLLLLFLFPPPPLPAPPCCAWLPQTAVMYLLAHASRGFMTRINSTSVEGGQHMEAALSRELGRPLITVSNHVASMDDPLVMSTILPPSVYADPQQLR